MRKILASLLMLTMFASAVLCGCGHEARANSGVVSHSHHDKAADSGDHHHDGKGSKASEDCQKADVQLPASVAIATPDLKGGLHLDFALTTEQAISRFNVASARSIRGPPPWDDDVSHSKLPVFLTTQRLRI